MELHLPDISNLHLFLNICYKISLLLWAGYWNIALLKMKGNVLTELSGRLLLRKEPAQRRHITEVQS